MWCSHCQQDVPGIVSKEHEFQYCCARCNGLLPKEKSATLYPTAEANDNDEFQPQQSPADVEGDPHQIPFQLDNWELENELLAAERLVRCVGLAPSAEADKASEKLFDMAHLHIPADHLQRQRFAAPADHLSKPEPTQRQGSGFFTWTLLSLGIMTFVCGGVLLGWSFATSRAELWNIGMPLALAGQAMLIVGLVMQLDGLWQSRQKTTSTLDNLDEQLNELRHTTTMLSTTHSSSSQSFYAHMAEGASSELLLADLKGQMDMLAVRMAKQRR